VGDIALEQHFTIREVAEMWHVSDDTVRKVFRDEPGVLAIGSEESRFKRGYVTLLIPESVVKAVHRKHRRRSSRAPQAPAIVVKPKRPAETAQTSDRMLAYRNDGHKPSSGLVATDEVMPSPST